MAGLSAASKEVTIAQMSGLWMDTWDVPSDSIVAKLGCSGCKNSVCFQAKGVNVNAAPQDRSSDTLDLIAIIKSVDNFTMMECGSTAEITNSECDRARTGECPIQDQIETAVDLVNEQFSANLTY